MADDLGWDDGAKSEPSAVKMHTFTSHPHCEHHLWTEMTPNKWCLRLNKWFLHTQQYGIMAFVKFWPHIYHHIWIWATCLPILLFCCHLMSFDNSKRPQMGSTLKRNCTRGHVFLSKNVHLKRKVGDFCYSILPFGQVLMGINLGKCNGKITAKQNVISSPDGTPTDRPQSIHWPSDAYSSIFNKNPEAPAKITSSNPHSYDLLICNFWENIKFCQSICDIFSSHYF